MRDKNTVFHQNYSLNIGSRSIDLSTPRVMGILNLTPDSFYDGGRHNTLESAMHKAEQMLSEGADFIDIGAYSSRPGAIDISVAEEKERLLPVIEMLLKRFPDTLISIDTFRSEVAKEALDKGVHIINDISAGMLDNKMLGTVAKFNAPYIMMHMKGSPQTMQSEAFYTDVVKEVVDYFIARIKQAKESGINNLIIDPGFGFAKNNVHNYALLNHLDELNSLGFPLLAGVSRKSMIWKTLEITAEEALNGTTVLNTVALLKGACILRVHDVKPAVEAIKLVSQLKSA
ncbi:MAG TPA: dihydropteroate synthase [Sphingobacteriaceae bacterium]